MGYVELNTAVTHVWYLKSVPTYLGRVLDYTAKTLDEIVYYTSYFDEDLGQESAKVGAEVLLEELQQLNLKEKIENNRKLVTKLKKEADIKKVFRQTRILESFLTNNSKPEWMILTLLPVIPPGLRPMVQLDKGQFASSDLNELYRRVIFRNNRLYRFIKMVAPAMVISQEKRLLQEAVDNLIDNGKAGPKTVDANNRALKSLANTIQGKQGRFRQNLLGKRVDYSGRSVIVVGPHLELNQCGLPYDLATELFFPFIAYDLLKAELALTIRQARTVVQSRKPFLWELVKKIVEGHPILLNRAPTLHRLGIQVFDPILIRGLAIQLHPLVCPAFNADFDGDQMAVHIPLSLEAQIEARILMMAPINFLSPATGEPIIQPSQDMLLGAYYLTLSNRPNLQNANHYFSSFDDVLFAYDQKQISLHTSLWVRLKEDIDVENKDPLLRSLLFSDQSKLSIYKNLQCRHSKEGSLIVQYLRTTPGRIIFSQSLNFASKLQ